MGRKCIDSKVEGIKFDLVLRGYSKVAQTDNPIVPKTADRSATPAKSADSAHDALQHHANDLRQAGQKPTDAKAKPPEVDASKVADRLKLTIQPDDLKVVAQEQSMKVAREQLLDQLKKPGTDAKTLQATQDNFKKQVNDAISTSNDLSKGDHGSRPIDRINSSLAATERHQADLEKTLKLTPANQPSTIKALLSKDSSTLNPTEKDYVETLTMKEALTRAKESASVSNAMYGSAVAQGLIGDLSHRDSKGMATPSKAEVAEAFTKMGIAHRLNGESREPGSFKDDYTTIVSKYAEQLSATGKSTLQDLNKASAEWHTNPAGAESLLRSANYATDSLNIPQIQEQLNANKNNPQITQQLTDVLKIANSTRVEYASFLYENGRLGESKAKLAQAQAETPTQCASDPSCTQLVDKTQVQENLVGNSITGLRQNYDTLVGQRKWDQADAAAKQIQDATNARIKQTDTGKALLDQQQTQLQEKMATAKTQAEKDTLTAQINTLKSQDVNFDLQNQTDTSNLAYLSYRQGLLHHAEGKNAEANEDFKKVAGIDPSMAKSLNDNPPGGQPKLDDLIKATKDPSWWQSHWKMVAGIGVGIAATAIVIGTGGAALPFVALALGDGALGIAASAGVVIAGGGAVYAGAGATAGETSLKEVGINFGVGCATTAVNVALKFVPVGTLVSAATKFLPFAQAAVTTGEGAASVAVANVAKEGLEEAAKLTANEVTNAGVTTVVGEGGKAALTETGKVALAETGKAVVANQAAVETGKVVVTEAAKTTAEQQAGSTFVSNAANFGDKLWTSVKTIPSDLVEAGKNLPANTLQAGKDIFSLNTIKNFVGYNTVKEIAAAKTPEALKAVAVSTFNAASTQIGVGATLLGGYEGVYSMGIKHESASQMYSHLGRDALYTALAIRGGAALSEATPALSFFNSGMSASGMRIGSTIGGYSFAAVPEVQNYYNGNQTLDQTIQGTLAGGSMASFNFGMTSSAMSKYLTAEKLITTAGALNTRALVSGVVQSAIPYATTEAIGDGYTAYTSIPLDPTKDANKITNAYVNQNGYDQVSPETPDSQ